MANILLTERCVRSCPYCFAKKHMADANPDDILSWSDFLYLVDLLQSSGENHVSLLGGEPTLHPDFVAFVRYLLDRRFHVNVFTSGVLSPATLEHGRRHLVDVAPDALSFVCNLNDPRISPEGERRRIADFLTTFGRQSSLSVNIYTLDFDLGYACDTILRYNLKRNIRIGLAQPIPGEKNAHIAVAELPAFAARLASFAPMLVKLQITVGLDCGIPMCLFSDEQIGAMFKASHGNLRFGCGPAIDFGSDMTVWSCFPLAGYHRRSVYDFDSLADIRGFFESLHAKIKSEAGGIFLDCDDCPHRQSGLCRGGCAAHLLDAMRCEEPTRIGEVYR